MWLCKVAGREQGGVARPARFGLFRLISGGDQRPSDAAIWKYFEAKNLTTRIDSLTPLRGMAALLVVLHHYSAYLLPQLGENLAGYSSFLLGSYLWVDFFFILSGFVLAHVYARSFDQGVNKPGYWKFVQARFARIYPLHLLVLMLFVGFEFLSIAVFVVQHGGSELISATSGYAPFTEKHSLIALVNNLLLLQAIPEGTTWNEPAWSISAEWFAYLLFPFIVSLFALHRKNIALLAWGGMFVGLYILIEQTRGHLDFSGWPAIIRAVMEFIIGLTLYTFYRKRMLSKLFEASLTFPAVLLLVFWMLHVDVDDIFFIPAMSLLVLSAAQSQGVFSQWVNSAIPTWLGNISYSVYMTHWLIYYVSMKLWFKATQAPIDEGLSTLEAAGLMLVYLSVVLMVSTVTYRKFELPARDYLRQLNVRRHPVTV